MMKHRVVAYDIAWGNDYVVSREAQFSHYDDAKTLYEMWKDQHDYVDLENIDERGY